MLDFLVVGAGIAGASVAYELAAHGSVLVCEMEATPGHHTTGRSAALFTECDGPDQIRRLAAASRPFLAVPPPKHFPQPLLKDRGVLFTALPGRETQLEHMYREQVALTPSIRLVEASEAIDMCQVLRPDQVAGAVFEPDAQDIDVHTLHQGFLEGTRQRGGTIDTSAKVVALDRVPNGWRVTTTEGESVARTVVNAAGAWCDRVALLAGARPVGLVPKRRTAFTFAPPSGVDHAGWPMVIDIDETVYFRPEGANLLASPLDQTPVEPQDIRHEEIDVARAIDRLHTYTTMEVKHVRSAWAGLRSFVADKLPVVGFDPGVDGFFWLAGQGGYGILSSPAMSQLAAALATESALPQHLEAAGVDPNLLGPNRLAR